MIINLNEINDPPYVEEMRTKADALLDKVRTGSREVRETVGKMLEKT